MRVLFICKRFYTNKDLIKDRFQRYYEIPKELGRLGWRVSVLALDYRTNELLRLDESPVVYESLPIFSPQRFEANLALIERTHEFKPDIIYASGNSNIGYLALWIARFFKKPFVFDLIDYYPGFDSASIPGMAYMFRKSIEHASLVSCVSRPLCEKVEKMSGRALLVPGAVNAQIFRPIEQAVARKHVGLPSELKFVCYVGSIGERSGLATLIAAVEIIYQNDQQVRLLVVGKKCCEIDLSLPWIDYRGEVDFEEVPYYVNAADVCVLPYVETKQNRYAGPSKLAEYMACDVPVVTTDVGNYSDLVSGHTRCVCKVNDVSDMSVKIQQQLTNPILCPFPEYLTWSSVGTSLDASFRRLIE